MRVEEAFAAAGVNVHGQPIPERRFRATCPECSHAAALDTMETTESGEQTNYCQAQPKSAPVSAGEKCTTWGRVGGRAACSEGVSGAPVASISRAVRFGRAIRLDRGAAAAQAESRSDGA